MKKIKQYSFKRGASFVLKMGTKIVPDAKKKQNKKFCRVNDQLTLAELRLYCPMEKALVNYSTKMGMTARKSAKIQNENLDNLRDMAACLVNGDTYTYTIIFESGKMKGYMEDHSYSCGGKNCKCVFKSENPRRLKK